MGNNCNGYKTLNHLEVLDQEKNVIKQNEKNQKILSLILGVIALAFLAIKTVYLYPKQIDSPLIPGYAKDLIQKDFKMFIIPCLLLYTSYAHLLFRKKYKWAIMLAISTLLVSYFNPLVYLLVQ